ncbi:MAG TPA: DUF2911 domain-containing protein [Bacteroidetes bacterium]|nr:DUF2911 domain-containing protein [Bacteroidota bacterium]
MKKLLFTFFAIAALAAFTVAGAQINTPAPSPFCKMEQKVGLTDVTLEYSRPSMRGRKLFVDVESFGKIWRTGANASTKITFSDDVKLEGHNIPAGTYAIYTIPDPSTWTVMIYKDLTIGGNISKYDEANELVRFKVARKRLSEPVETFTINIGNFAANTAEIALQWGEYHVPIKLEVNYDDKVVKDIERTMAGPSRSEYYTAANYYFNSGRDLNQALAWAKKANEMGERYWQLRLQAKIEAKMGKYKEAIATANRSSAVAKEAGNEDYKKGNDKYIADWSAKMR